MSEPNFLVLERTFYVHLKAKGEICNRLKKGVKVHILQRDESWVRIAWRNGKKKGWIFLGEKDNANA